MFITDNEIYLHFPKCGGTSMFTAFRGRGLIRKTIEPAHTGLFHINKQNQTMYNTTCVLRNPMEFYISLFLFCTKHTDNPYNILNQQGEFENFIDACMNVHTLDVNLIDSFFTDWFTKHQNKNFCELSEQITNGNLVTAHPFINILSLSKLNSKLDCGLMTYIYVYLTAKDPYYIFKNFTTKELAQNIQNPAYFYTVKTINLSDATNMFNLGKLNNGKHESTYSKYTYSNTNKIIKKDFVIYDLLFSSSRI